MSSLPSSGRSRAFQLLLSTFVAPAERSGPTRSRPPARALAVLSTPGDVLAASAAVALREMAEQHLACALVAVWSADRAPRAMASMPPVGAARRLATSLAVRGHDATATGRLAIVRLTADPDEAAAEARRAFAAATSVPTVLALGGPRPPALDAALADQDLVVVATRPHDDPLLVDLALSTLSERGLPAQARPAPASPLARLLATAGLPLPSPLRRPPARLPEALG
jgi:hypothetical protein